MSGALVAVMAILAVQDSPPGPVLSVPEVDLERYAGRWHEVARLPNKFQGKCVGGTTADYELLADGALRVVNACRGADGRITKVEGRARLANRDGPTSRLKVRFAPAILSWLPMPAAIALVIGVSLLCLVRLVFDMSAPSSRAILRILQHTKVTYQGAAKQSSTIIASNQAF